MSVYKHIRNKIISWGLRHDVVEVIGKDINCNNINGVSKEKLINHIRNGFLEEGYDPKKHTIILDKNLEPIDGNNRSYLIRRYFPEEKIKVKKLKMGKIMFYILFVLFYNEESIEFFEQNRGK